MTEISRRNFLKTAGAALGAAVLAPPRVAEAADVGVEQIRAQIKAAVKYAYSHISPEDNFNLTEAISGIFTTQAQRGDLIGAIETAKKFRGLTTNPESQYYYGLTDLAKIAVEQEAPKALKELLEFEESRDSLGLHNDYVYHQLDYYVYLAEAQSGAGSPSAELDFTLARVLKLREDREYGKYEAAKIDNRVNVATIRSSFRNGERPLEEALDYSLGVACNFLRTEGDGGYRGMAQGHSTIVKELVQAKREDLIDPLIKSVSQLNPGSDLASQKGIAFFGIASGLCELGLTYWPKQLVDGMEEDYLKGDLHSQIARVIAKRG